MPAQSRGDLIVIYRPICICESQSDVNLPARFRLKSEQKKVSFLRKLVKTSYTDGFCTKRLLTRPHKKAEAILRTSLPRFSYRIGLSSEKFELCSQGITYFMLGVKTSSRFSLLVWSSFHFVQFLLWKSMSVRRVMGWGGARWDLTKFGRKYAAETLSLLSMRLQLPSKLNPTTCAIF